MEELEICIRDDRELIVLHCISELPEDETKLKYGTGVQRRNHFVFLVKLKNGERYIIDLAGSQFGQHQAVMSFNQYHIQYVKTFDGLNELDTMAKDRQRERFGNTMRKVTAMLDARLRHTWSVLIGIIWFLENECKDAVDVVQMLAEKELKYQAKKARPVTFISGGLRVSVERIEKEAVKLKNPELEERRFRTWRASVADGTTTEYIDPGVAPSLANYLALMKLDQEKEVGSETPGKERTTHEEKEGVLVKIEQSFLDKVAKAYGVDGTQNSDARYKGPDGTARRDSRFDEFVQRFKADGGLL